MTPLEWVLVGINFTSFSGTMFFLFLARQARRQNEAYGKRRWAVACAIFDMHLAMGPLRPCDRRRLAVSLPLGEFEEYLPDAEYKALREKARAAMDPGPGVGRDHV